VPTTVVSLDDSGVAVLDQVAVGLLPVTALPPADVYLDAEGTPVATRELDDITLSAPSRWARPGDVRTDAPVVVAVHEALPVGALPSPDAVLLLPAGGARPDDARFVAWAHAWRAVASAVVEIPVPPADVAGRVREIAAAYSSGDLLEIGTVPQPPGVGQTFFFTGLSGSGKSTLARSLAARLVADRTVTLLDGDVVRSHLSKGLGFSREDRDTNIRRIGWVAAEVTKHGGIAICAPIAPYDETRQWVRNAVEAAGGPGAFVLVWVATPLDVCEQRDPKGLYAKARAGELSGFTGIDDPYEPPHDADVVVDTSKTTVKECVDAVLSALRPTVGGLTS
jgi:sulfate adenylyltransferase